VHVAKNQTNSIMKLGIDSFAAVPYDTAATSTPQDRANALEALLDRIVAME